MEPIIIRTKPDAKLAAAIALAGTGAVLIVLSSFGSLFLALVGIVLAIAGAVLIYLVGRRGVLVYDGAVFVREYVGTTKYRWSRIAGFGTTTSQSGGTIGALNLVNGEDVPLPIWVDPDPAVVQRLDVEARRRQAEL